jgi:hypothetical protein
MLAKRESILLHTKLRLFQATLFAPYYYDILSLQNCGGEVPAKWKPHFFLQSYIFVAGEPSKLYLISCVGHLCPPNSRKQEND